jgi:hypothetical protein
MPSLTQCEFNEIIDTYLYAVMVRFFFPDDRNTIASATQNYRKAINAYSPSAAFYESEAETYLSLLVDQKVEISEIKRSGGRRWYGYEEEKYKLLCVSIQSITLQLEKDFKASGALTYTGFYLSGYSEQSRAVSLNLASITKSSKNVPNTHFNFMLACVSHPLIALSAMGLMLSAVTFSSKKNRLVAPALGTGLLGLNLGCNAHTFFSGSNRYLGPEVLTEDLYIKALGKGF